MVYVLVVISAVGVLRIFAISGLDRIIPNFANSGRSPRPSGSRATHRQQLSTDCAGARSAPVLLTGARSLPSAILMGRSALT